MISAAVLDAMVASGCTPEQIAAAVKAAVVAHEAEIEAKREYERNRKREYRAGKKAESTTYNNVSPGQPGTSGDNAGHDGTDRDNRDTVSLSPVPLLPPTPPNNPLTPNPIQKLSGARGFRLPEDWVLTGPDLAYALSKGFSEQQTGEIFEKFTNHWWSSTGKNAVKKNWHQAWRVWLLNEKPSARAGPAAKPASPYRQAQNDLKEIINDLDNFATGRGGSNETHSGFLSGNPSERPKELRGGPGGAVIDLPAGSYRTGN